LAKHSVTAQRIDQPPKKKKRKAAKGLLSFGEDEEQDDISNSTPARSARLSAEVSPESSTTKVAPKKLTANPNSIIPAPRALTKAALAADAATRDKLRKEFLEIQEVVKETEIFVPFVFYDGANTPGGRVKVTKGDHIWLFLERCRKVGAELGVSGSGSTSGVSLKSKEDSRKQWARVGVDDLMCVRGEVIVPHVSIGYSQTTDMVQSLTLFSITNFITS
jgi:protein FAM50